MNISHRTLDQSGDPRLLDDHAFGQSERIQMRLTAETHAVVWTIGVDGMHDPHRNRSDSVAAEGPYGAEA